jgi:hypothetical protein
MGVSTTLATFVPIPSSFIFVLFVALLRLTISYLRKSASICGLPVLVLAPLRLCVRFFLCICGTRSARPLGHVYSHN